MEHLSEQLRLGAASLGLDLAGEALAQLSGHLALLQQWNTKLNLVGPGDLATWADRHTLDSLAAAQWLPDLGEVIDVGSGAGFPGLPLAIVAPKLGFRLVEPRANRGAFLQNVVARLGLKNTRIVVARAETVEARADLVTGRAVAQPEQWAEMASALLKPAGRFILFAQDEAPTTLAGCRRLTSRRYRAGAEATRTLGLYVSRETSAQFLDPAPDDV